jgi:hypothetical protein
MLIQCPIIAKIGIFVPFVVYALNNSAIDEQSYLSCSLNAAILAAYLSITQS